MRESRCLLLCKQTASCLSPLANNLIWGCDSTRWQVQSWWSHLTAEYFIVIHEKLLCSSVLLFRCFLWSALLTLRLRQAASSWWTTSFSGLTFAILPRLCLWTWVSAACITSLISSLQLLPEFSELLIQLLYHWLVWGPELAAMCSAISELYYHWNFSLQFGVLSLYFPHLVYSCAISYISFLLQYASWAEFSGLCLRLLWFWMCFCLSVWWRFGPCSFVLWIFCLCLFRKAHWGKNTNPIPYNYFSSSSSLLLLLNATNTEFPSLVTLGTRTSMAPTHLYNIQFLFFRCLGPQLSTSAAQCEMQINNRIDSIALNV